MANGRWFFVGALLLVPAVGCHVEPPAPDIETRGSALVSRNATLNLVVPAGANVATFALAANGSLTLGDRAVIGAPISNVGGTGTSIGNDARTAAVSSVSTLTVGDRTVVNGPVNTTGAIQASPSSTITGPVNTHAVLTPASVRSLNVLFPSADTSDVTVAPDQTASAGPGRYGAMSIQTRARLRLRTGTYYLESLTIEPQAILDLDEQSGPVVIYVNAPFAFRGSIVTNKPGPNVLIGVVGPGTVTIESPFQGTIVAPSATLSFSVGNLTHTGAFFARDIALQRGVSIVFHASVGLPGCDDGNACTGRDTLQGGVCVGGDPIVLSVAESDPTAPRCADGSLRVGCRAYDCTTGLPTGTWLNAPVCGPAFPSCLASCPAAGCIATAPRNTALVTCNCACADPAGGTSFAVKADGCGTTAASSCDAICSAATRGCGTDSSCLGTCTSTGAAPVVLSTNVCRASDPLSVPRVSDYLAVVDSAASRLTVSVGPTTTTIPVSGEIGFQVVPPDTSAPRGSVRLNRMTLSGSTFNFFGRSVASPRLIMTSGNSGPSSTSGTLNVTFPASSLSHRLTATVDGVPRTFDATSPAGLAAAVDLTARRIDLTSTGTLPGGDRVSITLVGRLLNLPPVARFRNPPAPTLECNTSGGRSTGFDGTSATDPEGQTLRYQWFRSVPGAMDLTTTAVGAGATTTVFLPLGPQRITLKVYDPQLLPSSTVTDVTVVDTTPPSVPALPAVTFHAGSEATQMHVVLNYPTGSDVCSPVTFSAFRLVIEPDSGTVLVPIDPRNVTLPVGTSTIVWRATDRSGNITQVNQSDQVLASPGEDPPPNPVPAPACPNPAQPLNLPGPATVPVNVRFCVVGGKIGGTQRTGSPYWAKCPDVPDASDTCTTANIQNALTQGNTLYAAPGQAPVVQFNFVGWKRIRDPQMFAADPPTSYGVAPIPLASNHSFGFEINQMFADCYAAWGIPPPNATHTAEQGGCLRDPMVVSVALEPCHSIGCPAVLVGGAYQSSCPTATRDPACDYSNICDRTFNPQAVIANDDPLTLAHELGHVLGLPHGDGTDDDCNGLWDEDCDSAETADDVMDSNKNLMRNSGGTEPLTVLQRDRVRTVALKSVPTLGPADLSKCAFNEPVPPLPIPANDNIAVPTDGGITGDGGSAPQPPPPTCGCELDDHGSRSIAAIACLAALFWLSRMRMR
jgi:hypothetical protein